MGFISKLVYAILLPTKVREAVALDELKKLNETIGKGKR